MKDYLKIAGNVHLSYYVEAADQLGIKYNILVRNLLAQFTYKDKHWFIVNTATPLTNSPSSTIAKRKNLTNIVLAKHGIPVPAQNGLKSKEDAIEFFNKHNDIVIKPAQNLGGKGITMLPRTDNEVVEGYKIALEKDLSKDVTKVLGEEYIHGTDYRLLTLETGVIGVVKRIPAQVTGDGKNTIEQLIKNENKKRKEKLLKPIPIDSESLTKLRTQGLSLTSVPSKDKVISLRFNSNLTTGGTTEECSSQMDPYYEELAIKALKALNLKFGGVDLIAKDITKKDICVVNEVNYNPGLRLHYKVDKGEVIKVAVPIMEYIRDNS